MARLSLAVLCVLMVPSALWAGGKASSKWENLNSLRAGEKIQVLDAAGKKHSGSFSSVTSAAIVLHGKSGDETIQRDTVLRVSAGGHRKRNILIGAAVGAGALAAAGAAGTSGSCSSFCIGKVTRGDVTAAAAGLGAVAGAVIGAVLPTHKTIYRAP